jgi:hypothetical protein
MIKVRVSLEQARALVRRIAPKLSIQQRMQLLRELARDDLSHGAPPRREDTPAPTAHREPPALTVTTAPAVAEKAPERDDAFIWNESPVPAVPEAAGEPPVASLTSPPEEKDDASGRIAWERRLYRLFKPARAQAKHLEGPQLSDLIRRSVVEVRQR